MKFSSHEDIEAPIEDVFRDISDFPVFERQALRRGAEVQRRDTLTAPGAGMMWDVAFDLRGKRREMLLELTRLDPPNGLLVAAGSPNISALFEVELVALSRRRTRLSTLLSLEAKTLSARLLLQSMKLARKSLNRRFRKRVAEFATDLENRHRGSASA